MSGVPFLLLIEDDDAIRTGLELGLSRQGHRVVAAATGEDGLKLLKEQRPDLIVLDVMLPDMDGFDVIRRLRGGGARIPVVFLTARDGTDDKIRGLTLGGDDYVTKPFSLEEVIARIKAVLRRTRGDGVEPTPRLKFADLELDEESHEVWRGGAQVQLSPTEFKLLRYFMSNANRVLSKMQILDHVLSSEVVVLDDLGSERPTEWVRDTFAYILNTRYNQKLTTLITSNFDDQPREFKALSNGSRVPSEESLAVLFSAACFPSYTTAQCSASGSARLILSFHPTERLM